VDIPDYDNLKNFDEDITAGSFLFTNLKEASLYQVKIASENTFGMSNPKNIFTFATKGADPVQQPMIVPSSSSMDGLSSFLTLALILVTLRL